MFFVVLCSGLVQTGLVSVNRMPRKKQMACKHSGGRAPRKCRFGMSSFKCGIYSDLVEIFTFV